MIIQRPKRLLFWILFGIISYQLFHFFKEQTYDDVVVYKRLATAIMENDDYIIEHVTDDKVSSLILKTQFERDQLFYGSHILFTYYRVLSRSLSPDEKIVFLETEQVSRVNPPGYDTLWGENFVRIKHEVRLMKKNDRWVIVSFEDPAIDS